MILIKNKVLASLLQKKDDEIQKGRDMSKELEKNEKRIVELKAIEHKATEKIKCAELVNKAMAIAEKMDSMAEELDVIYADVRAEKIKAIPDEVRLEHEELLEKNKKITKARQKVGEAVNKLKDKIVPTIQKKALPEMPSEFHDIGTAKLNKDGDIEVEVFSHLDDFKKKYRERAKKK